MQLTESNDALKTLMDLLPLVKKCRKCADGTLHSKFAAALIFITRSH